MGYLIDTNILLRSCQPDHPMYPIAVGAVETLFARGEELYIFISHHKTSLSSGTSALDHWIKMGWV